MFVEFSNVIGSPHLVQRDCRVSVSRWEIEGKIEYDAFDLQLFFLK